MARCIMVQGTMSSAGKSLLAAGLCRIFKQDGLRCAPFKSQNMALNSFITKDGLEMGRAQVMQAQAAGVEPDVRMNPILLKPTGDTGSQVIVNGEVLGQMSAADYFRMKKALIPHILKAYDELAAQYDVIVLEGAAPLAALTGEAPAPFTAQDGVCRNNVMGLYVHGLFEEGDLAARLAALLMERKGFTPGQAPALSWAAYRETQYDRLADAMRAALDLPAIYRMMEGSGRN